MDELESRVRYVCSLKAGWLGRDEGDAIDVDPDAVLRVVRALMAQGFDCPAVNPTHDGFVNLEWFNGLSLTVFTP